MRATARPWLPSVAVTIVSWGEPAARRPSRRLSTVMFSAGSPIRWATARHTAHEAPRILKAGRPRRSDSSLTNTRPTPSSAARAGSSRRAVGE